MRAKAIAAFLTATAIVGARAQRRDRGGQLVQAEAGGMKAKALNGLLAATAFVMLLLPAVAIARPRPADRQTAPEVSAHFALKGTNGFDVDVSLTDRRRLTFSALNFDNVLEAVSYKLRVHPRRGSDDIVADLGKLGRLDVRFIPGKIRYEKPPEDCHGGRTVIEQGHFVGLIAFHAEAGFTEVHAHRAAGVITRTPPETCSPVRPLNLKKLRRELEALEKEAKDEEAEKEEEAKEETLSVGLHATALGGRVTLAASKVGIKEKNGKGFSLSNLVVTGARQRGRIREESTAAELFAKGSTFLIPNRKKPASEGVLQPPAPFSGSATFRRHPKKPPTWTGDLKVDLPGFGEVRLAGPGTHASMCEGPACLLRGAPSARGLLRRLG